MIDLRLDLSPKTVQNLLKLAEGVPPKIAAVVRMKTVKREGLMYVRVCDRQERVLFHAVRTFDHWKHNMSAHMCIPEALLLESRFAFGFVEIRFQDVFGVLHIALRVLMRS